ncbi:MAG: hypothetical protein MEQ74_05180 [Paracoccus sp.]|nr:hypothetical protein [Paracoccus sp. (in: a-proteobacteria)]
MSLEQKINNNAKPETTSAAPDPTGDSAREQTTRVSGGGLNSRMPDHVKLREHEIDHLQEKTTGSWSHFYRTDGVIDPGLGSRYTIRAANNLGLALGKPPAFPAEQKHPDVNRYRQWEVELIIFHAAEVGIDWPDGVIWPNKEVPSEADPTVMETVEGGPPENPRPAGRADRFMLRYDERTGEWWAWLTHEGVLSRDPEAPVDDPTEENPDDGEGDEDGAPGDGERPSAREGTLFALHFDGYSRTDDCGASWVRHRVPGDGSFAAFSVLDNIAFMTTSGRLYTALDKGSLLTEILSPVNDRVEESGLINPDFETGDTRGWSVFPEWAADALATSQPPQLPGSTHYLGRADLVAARDVDWRVSQKPPEQILTKPVDILVDVYRSAGATAELILTSQGIRNQRPDFSAGLISAGGSGSVGRKWLIPQFSTLNGTTAPLEVEVIASSGSSVDVQGGLVTAGTSSITINSAGNATLRFTRGHVEKGMILRFVDIDTNESMTLLTPEVTGHLYDNTQISVSNGGRKFSGGSSVNIQDGRSELNVFIPPLVSVFDIVFETNFGAIGLVDSDHPAGLAPSTPNIDTVVAAPEKDGAWETISLSDFVFTDQPAQSLITLRGVGDVWFDNLRVTQSVREATSYTALARDLATRRHVALAEGSLTLIGQDGTQTVQEIPAEVLGDTLAVRSGLVLVALENKLHRSGDLGKTWLSADLPDAARQIIIGPAPVNSGPIIPPGIGGLIDALGGLTKVTNGILDVTGNEPITVPDVNPTPSSTETIAIMLAGGSVVSLEPGMQVVLRQAFPPNSHLSWDSRRKSWVVVQSDGVIKMSQNLTVWTTVEAIASNIGGISELRLLPCDIGRWFGYRRGALSLGFTDDTKIGLTNTVPLATAIRDMVEKK